MRTTRDGRPPSPPSSPSDVVLVHPDQVLDHPSMSDAEKRALLSSWASDRHAVENAPALRRLDSGAVVPVDDILAALAALPADPSSSIRAPAGPPWSGASGLSFPQAEGAVEDEGWLVPE